MEAIIILIYLKITNSIDPKSLNLTSSNQHVQFNVIPKHLTADTPCKCIELDSAK